MTDRNRLALKLAAGGTIASLVGIPAGLQLWTEEPACKPCVVLVGTAPASCPDARHQQTEVWSDDWSTLHLQCECRY